MVVLFTGIKVLCILRLLSIRVLNKAVVYHSPRWENRADASVGGAHLGLKCCLLGGPHLVTLTSLVTATVVLEGVRGIPGYMPTRSTRYTDIAGWEFFHL